MFENIKAIAMDIDGTITPGSQDPNENTIRCINELHDKGYLLGLSSGRTVSDMLEKYKIWGVNKQFDFIIGFNGGELYIKELDKTFSYNPLKKEWIKEIIDFMDEFDVNVHMYKPGVYLSSKETDRAWYSAYKNKRVFTVCDTEEFYKEDSLGIMFRCPKEIMPSIEKKLETIKDKPYHGFKTQSTMMEFAHKDCNKGFALEKYAEYLKINIKEIAAFGDTTNDNEMLKRATGICLLNGSDDAKASAEYITDKTVDEDGFVDFVERNILHD